MHSAFFFKFLNSPNKIAKSRAQSRFKYFWVTQYEEAGSWCLVADCSAQMSKPDVKISGLYKHQQTEAFQNLLTAMYTEPYFVQSLQQLRIMIELADYYCALPILSKTLPITLSERLLEIHKSTKELLDIACKLRQEDLFKECVTMLAGDWSSEAMKPIDELDWDLRTIVMVARGRVALTMAKAVEDLLTMTYNKDLATLLTDVVRGQTMPEYYRDIINRLNIRDIKDQRISNDMIDNVKEMLMPLMKNNLRFTRMDGEDNFKRYFLYATVFPREFPWKYERDWWRMSNTGVMSWDHFRMRVGRLFEVVPLDFENTHQHHLHFNFLLESPSVPRC